MKNDIKEIKELVENMIKFYPSYHLFSLSEFDRT